jgi:hypothetical protein
MIYFTEKNNINWRWVQKYDTLFNVMKSYKSLEKNITGRKKTNHGKNRGCRVAPIDQGLKHLGKGLCGHVLIKRQLLQVCNLLQRV